MGIFDIFTLLGGVALFLFGMETMSKALEKQAGSSLGRILGTMTGTRFRAFLLGFVVTAAIHSSGAVTVMLVGFVNSGVMTFQQALGVIMGSNVGTTVTAWLLSLSDIQGDNIILMLLEPKNFTPLLAVIGIGLRMISKHDRKRGIGTILLGFAILMTGMDIMSSAMQPLADEPWFAPLFVKFTNPILGMIVGALLTALLQSSTASVGVLQALGDTGAITYASAIPIILGQNIGTCVTSLISAAGANKNAKRTALVHLYFNLIGSVIFLALFYTVNHFVDFAFVNMPVTRFGISLVHTGFNIVATFIMLPLSRWLERLVMLTIPDSAEPEKNTLLDSRFLTTPALAVERSFAAAADMADMSRSSVSKAISLMQKWDDRQAEEIRNLEAQTDHYEDAIGTYLVQVSSKSMSAGDSHVVNILLHTISDLERIGDHALNLTDTAQEIRDKGITFSPDARQELQTLEEALAELLGLTVNCYRSRDLTVARQVEPLEQVIDDLVRKIKVHHVDRLKDGRCSIAYGFVLDDLLTAYERIADHCSNVAVAIIEVTEGSFDTHQYLTGVKNGNNDEFEQYYRTYRERYRLLEEVKQ